MQLYLCNIIKDSYIYGREIYVILGTIIGFFTIHLTFYFIVGIFFTRKFHKAKKNHKYAILIPARNEEKVIGNLLDSIKKQDYPSDKITVFVVSDNSTDKTKEIAVKNGAICYERFNDKDKTKGFALQFLIKNIDKDYGITSFDGYFIFDADNLLKSDYITRMNESFDEGCKIITSYRNTKNFDENWVASTYALHWLRSIRVRHRARSVLHLATNIQGTGFLFANEIIKDGWNYTSLTEDRALTADCVSKGYEITYNNDAMFYDEQPTNLKIAFRQRIRWSKGHLLAFRDSGPSLFKNIIFGVKPREKKKQNIFIRILNNLRFRFMSFDTFGQLLPRNILNIIRFIILNIIIYPIFCASFGINNLAILYNSTVVSKILIFLFGNVMINISPGIKAYFISILLVLSMRILLRIGLYFSNIPISIYLFFIERKRIIHISLPKKILYCFTWPFFDIMGRYSQYVALFKKVEWKPIPHTSKNKIEDIEKKEKKSIDFKKSIKKVFKSIKNNRKILYLMIPFILLDVIVRLFGYKAGFTSFYSIASILFTIIWSFLIVGIAVNLKNGIGKILYIISFLIFFLLFLTHLIYYNLTDFYFNFTLMEYASEGGTYIIDTLLNTTPLIYLVGLVIVVITTILCVKIKFGNKNNYKNILIIILIFIILHLIVPFTLGPKSNELKWNNFENKRYIYDEFSDSNKSMIVCGLYEYTFRNIYTLYFRKPEEISTKEKAFLDKNYNADGYTEKNDYTGKFKNKNVILLQLEGIDTWILNEQDTPNLYSLQNNAINFLNHYSIYTGGGSTFNSEFAINTGFTTPVSFNKNVYTYNTNTFNYTLPKLFKSSGYSANVFHMNKGSFYDRDINYKSWGYDKYYGLLDIKNYDNEEYKLDRELINNEVFYENMFLKNNKFLNYIITYSLHKPFDKTKEVCKVLLEEKYKSENIPSYTEEDCARLQAGETDKMVGMLIQALKDNNLYNNTVIVVFSDHYLYTLNDKTILEKYKNTDNNLVNKTPFFIWSADAERKDFNKVTSQLNILPTILNLFGIDYNKNYYLFEDALKTNYQGYAFFSDYSWYDGNVYVDNGEITNNAYISSDELKTTQEKVNNIIKKNDLTLKYDYLKNK